MIFISYFCDVININVMDLLHIIAVVVLVAIGIAIYINKRNA